MVKNKNVCTSTPTKRRLSSLETVFSPIVRRKSSIPPTPQVIENDDDAERSNRRVNAELHRRISSINSPSINVSTDFPGSNLQDHFDVCLRMFTQNKINATNVWKLHAIDLMRTVIFNSPELRSLLQVASTSLDIGAKIYSLRVDDLYSESLKLANVLARVNLNKNKQQSNNENISDEENDDNLEDNRTDQTKKKKKPRNLNNQGNRVTVTDNEESLNAPIAKHHSVTNSGSDTNDSRGLLNISLTKSQGASSELLVRNRSKECFWDVSLRKTRDVLENYYSDKLDTLPVNVICPPLHNFAIDQWDMDKEDELNQSNKFDELMFNENGIPIPDLDLENVDPNNDFDDDIVSEEIEYGAQAHQGPVETIFITDMRSVLTNQTNREKPLEYTYSQVPNMADRFNLTGVWAGPAHWKLKYLRRPSRIDSNGVTLQEKTAFKKAKPIIQPFKFSDFKDVEIVISKKRLTRVNVSTTLADCSLPEDMGFKSEFWRSLSGLPHRRANLKHYPSELENPDGMNYNYDNPNDNDYCNETVVDGWDNEGNASGHADNDDVPNTESITDELPNGNINEDDLIEAPHLVPQTYMTYAHKAKKMNMKKLKNLMWQEMVEDNGKPNDNEISMEIEEKVKPTSLNTIYRNIPKKMSKSMAENLSCPLAFVALLHLANEHELNLQSTDDLSDINISKED